MNKRTQILFIMTLVLLSNLFIFFPKSELNEINPNNIDNNEIQKELPYISNGLGYSDVIVFFNKSTYNSSVISNFTYHGGTLKVQWNNTFSNFSGFAGKILTSNITSFQGNITDATIETDEITEAQMNYATIQTGALNSTWHLNGYKGNTNSSIAILDTGVDPNHAFFPDGYNSENLSGNIVGWKDYINQEISPSDDNGHGTFISSVIAGTGTDYWNNTATINLQENYSHLDYFTDMAYKNYTIKIFTFNVSMINSNILINTSWSNIEGDYEGFWFDLYYNSTKVKSLPTFNPDQLYTLTHNVTQKKGIYDLYLIYHRYLGPQPNRFSIKTNITYYPVIYNLNYSYFTGIANASKIVSYKILNQTRLGYSSDVITALADVIQNQSLYHIISVCLSIATFGDNYSALSSVIDEVIEKGIVVVIASGNHGILQGSDPLNKLAMNKNAIVVGAINDKDQITSYSSRGKDVGDGVIKPDIVAPGGSILPKHLSIISADIKSNGTTIAYGTSIATAIVSAAINILIESKWGDWSIWKQLNPSERVKIIKSILLMTASETNLLREDDPTTSADESAQSPSTFTRTTLFTGIKDEHEGYGRLNIQAAIDALNKYVIIKVNDTLNGTLISSEVNPLGNHVFARRVVLNKSISYTFNLTLTSPTANFDMFLFSNETDEYGEPILLASSKQWYTPNSNQFYFTPTVNQTETILVVKAVVGSSNFEVYVTNISNQFAPVLSVPEVTWLYGSRNTTVLSVQEIQGNPQDKNYTLDQYRFFVQYSDNDTANAPPTEIYVSIAGQNYTLTIYPMSGLNYTDGVIYWSEAIEFATAGTYNYFFVGKDGVHETRYPAAGSFSIQIIAPVFKTIPYEHQFISATWDDWKATGTGWGLLTQTNIFDDRSRLLASALLPWNTIYFGMYHLFPQNYTYQPPLPYPYGTYPNGTVFSPWFNLTGISNPIVKFGLRTSLNLGDNIYLYITYEQWGQEDLLATFTYEEKEWFMLELNLTKYKGDLIQFRFESAMNNVIDTVKNRGFMLDYVAIEDYINLNSATVYVSGFYPDASTWTRVSPAGGGSRYQMFTFTCEYVDIDNNYPEYMILEFGRQSGQPGPQFDMLNIYGDWDATEINILDRGILFQKKVVVGTISNRTFRFRYSDGETENVTFWYNTNNNEIIFMNPTPLTYNVEKDGVDYSYQYSNTNLNDYFVSGTPSPQEYTAWLPADNTWHPINLGGQDMLYCGVGDISYGPEDFGYGANWDASLITYPLFVEGDHKVYFEFKQNTTLAFDYEPTWLGYNENNADKFYVSISTDYGNSWTPLSGLQYFYFTQNRPVMIKQDISNYANKVVMIKFTLDSNSNDLAGMGWRIFDISIGYDPNTDFINPVVSIISPQDLATLNSIITIEAQLSDNVGIDEDRILIQIGGKSVDRTLLKYDNHTGILTFEWDTTLYSDGLYKIEVIVFDEEGNRAETSITVSVDNGLIAFNKWWPWLLFILVVILLGLGLYIFAEKKGKYMIKDVKSRKIEKARIKEIDFQQAKEQLGLITLEEELKRPNILHCKGCGSWFYSEKFDIMCPICERDQIYAAYNCKNCKKWYLFDSPGEDYYCPKCSPKEIVESERKLLKKKKEINKRLGLRLIRREIEEVEEILSNEGKFLREFNLEKRDRRYSILD